MTTIKETFNALIMLKQSYGNSLTDETLNAILRYNAEFTIVRALLRLRTNEIECSDSEVHNAIIGAYEEACDIADALIELKSCGILLTPAYIVKLASARFFTIFPNLKKSDIIDVLIILSNKNIDLATWFLGMLGKKEESDRDVVMNLLIILDENGIEATFNILFMIGNTCDVIKTTDFINALISLKKSCGSLPAEKVLDEIFKRGRTDYAIPIINALRSLYVHGILLDSDAQYEIVLCDDRALNIASLLIQLKPYNVPFIATLIKNLRAYDHFLINDRNSNHYKLLHRDHFPLSAIASLCHAQIPLTVAIVDCFASKQQVAMYAAIGIIFLEQFGVSLIDIDDIANTTFSSYASLWATRLADFEACSEVCSMGDIIFKCINDYNKKIRDYLLLMRIEQRFLPFPLWDLFISYFNEIDDIDRLAAELSGNVTVHTAHFSEIPNDAAEEEKTVTPSEDPSILSPAKIYLKQSSSRILFFKHVNYEPILMRLEAIKSSADQDKKNEPIHSVCKIS